MIADVRVTVLDRSALTVQMLDAVSNGDFGNGVIKYEDTPTGNGAASMQIGLHWEEVFTRGYYVGLNVVEISTADNTMTAACNAGATKIYVDSNAGFDTSQGEDTQQAYFWDGATLCMRVPVTGVGSDAGGPYITVGAPFSGGGNPTTLPAYGIGTYVGRRRYSGRIIRRRRPNQKMPLAQVEMIGCASAFDQADGQTFTVNNIDVGTSIYNTLANFATRWPYLSISAGNFPSVGVNATASLQNCSVTQMLTTLLASVSSGDLWVVRVGHDRTPRLVKLYVSGTNTYTYARTLTQGVVEFEPMNVSAEDQDVSKLFNSIMVIGATDPGTQTPVSAIVQDATSIATYGQIDAQPVTNTALTTVAACAAYGNAMLKQWSLATASNSFRVYIRNDGAVANQPAGLTNGDVVRGVESVSITRFDAQGTVRNAVPDSGIFITNTSAIWTLVGSQASFGTGNGWGAANSVTVAGTGSSSGAQYGESGVIDVAPGQWWTVSSYINAAHVTGAVTPFVGVYDASLATQIATAPQTHGVNGRVSATFQIPANATYTQVRVLLHSNNCTIANAQNLIMSRPQLEPGTSLGSYVENDATPTLYGLASSCVTTIDAHGDRWQDVKFAAIEPDWNADIAERANALANQLIAQNNTGQGSQQYILSQYAFPPSYSGSSLSVTIPSYWALFAANTAQVQIAQASLTMTASSTNFVWVNPDGSYTVNQDPHVISGSILYGYFTASATGVIGFQQKASLGLLVGNQLQNLVINGNNWFGTGQYPPKSYGWTRTLNSGQIVSGGPYTVNGSTYASLQINPVTQGGAYQDIVVTPGQTYTYCVLLYSNPGGQARIWIGDTAFATQWNATPGLPMGSIGQYYSAASASHNGSTQGVNNRWECFYGTFTVPSNASTARVLLENVLNGGTASFDGVMVIQGNTLQDYVDAAPAPGQGNSTTPLNGNGALLNVSGTPVYTYGTTSSSITITIPATTYTRMDGSSISVPAYSPAPWTGLQANTTYYFDIWYDAVNNVYGVKFYGQTAPTNLQMLTDCFSDGHINIYAGYSVTTPKTGGGPGGGTGGGGQNQGGSCPAEYQLVRTLERDYIRADEVDLGMHLFGSDGQPARVLECNRVPTTLWRYTLSDGEREESFDVNDTHMVMTADGGWALVKQLRAGDSVKSRTGTVRIVDIEQIGPGHYIAFEVERHAFLMGECDSIVHNNLTFGG